MRKQDLEQLIRANLDLPVFKHIRKQIAEKLPDKGYHLEDEKAWSMAGDLMEKYISKNFNRLSDIYDYISKTEYKLAMDILENLK